MSGFTATVDALKSKGNELFKQASFAEAVEQYSQALLAARETGDAALVAVLLLNRAAAEFKLEEYKLALCDVNDSLSLHPDNPKALHRKAQVLFEVALYNQAIETYRDAIELGQERPFFEKQLKLLESKTSKLSASVKIDNYLKIHNTLIGCETKLSLSRFEMLDMIGEGNYSTVMKAKCAATGELFAIKMVDKNKADRMSRRHPNIHNEIQMEKQVLFRISHPNVVKLFHTFQDNTQLYFVSELGDSELWNRMRLGERLVGLRPSEVIFFAAQLINAISFLHSNGVIHRDIKPENMILFSSPDSRVTFLKLIDFGTAKDLVDTTYNGPNFVGTPEYMSPEVIHSKDADSTCDLWALGCTIYQMLCGNVPFRGGSAYLSFLKADAREFVFPEHFSPEAVDLIDRMLQIEPKSRLGAYETNYQSIRAHPFFAGVDFDALLEKPLLPPPTLFELCVESVGEHCAKKSRKVKLNSKRDWGTQYGSMSLGKLEQRPRAAVMGFLEQRGILGNANVFPLFFDTPLHARFARAVDRSFVGCSEKEQGKFLGPFLTMHAGSLHLDINDGVQLEAMVTKMNLLEPAPRMLIFTGNLFSRPATDREHWESVVTKFQTIVSKLNDSIPVVYAPGANDFFSDPHAKDGEAPALVSAIEVHRSRFGDDYFGFFIGGIYFIVVNSTLLKHCSPESSNTNTKAGDVESSENVHDLTKLADAHAEWFERQLLNGKLCARHVVVVSHHSWVTKTMTQPGGLSNDCDTQQHQHDDVVVPFHVRARFVKKMQDSGVNVILSSAAEKNKTLILPPSADLQPKVKLLAMGPLDVDGSDSQFRVLRALSMEVVGDVYHNSEMPNWLSLDDEALEEDSGVSSSSDDSISSTDESDSE